MTTEPLQVSTTTKGVDMCGISLNANRAGRAPASLTSPISSAKPFSSGKRPLSSPLLPAKKKPFRAPSPSAPAPSPTSQVKKSELDDMFGAISDDAKVRPPRPQTQKFRYEEDDEEDDGFSDPSSFGDEDEDTDSDGDDEYKNLAYPPDDEDIEPVKPSIQPSPGFATLDAEKHDLLYKLQAFKDSGKHGDVPAFTVHSDILEMRASLAMLQRRRAVQGAIEFQKKALGFLVSGIEYAATEYHVVTGLELEGWSAKICRDIENGQYTDIFTELGEKYTTGKGRTPPELRLAFMLCSSAAVHHLQRSLTKKTQFLMTSANNPASAFGSLPVAAPVQQSVQGTASIIQQPSQQPPPPPRPEMQPPAFDLAGLMAPLPALNTGALLPHVNTRPQAQPPPPPATAPPAPRSDTVTDIPDDLTSIISSIDEEGGAVPPGAKRGRGRPKKTTTEAKKILVI